MDGMDALRVLRSTVIFAPMRADTYVLLRACRVQRCEHAWVCACPRTCKLPAPNKYKSRGENDPVLLVMFRLISAYSLTKHYLINRNQPAFPPAEMAERGEGDLAPLAWLQ
jgi:hypothetical protein